MGDLVKLPNRLNRFWKRFVDYAKVGICLMLIVFLFQTIAGGSAVSVISLAIRGGILLAIAIGGAAGVAAAHEIRRPREGKDKREAWRRQVPW
jgi:uncharacterized RDD family membrane protein YckC